MTGYEHLFGLLAEAERFIAGFEGDDTQDEPVDDLLARIRAVLPQPVATLLPVCEDNPNGGRHD